MDDTACLWLYEYQQVTSMPLLVVVGKIVSSLWRLTCPNFSYTRPNIDSLLSFHAMSNKVRRCVPGLARPMKPNGPLSFLFQFSIPRAVIGFFKPQRSLAAVHHLLSKPSQAQGGRHLGVLPHTSCYRHTVGSFLAVLCFHFLCLSLDPLQTQIVFIFFLSYPAFSLSSLLLAGDASSTPFATDRP